ncbi:MAG TPA: acyl-CoA synthetase [Chloroflexota bacterium]|nr:acyl-CoA synthetase [Chloroflexota bacterium]
MPEYPGSIVEAFLRSRERMPEKACILFYGDTYTYERLGREVERWVAALRRWGLRPGDRIALFLANSPAFAAAYLGIQLAGGIVVLVNTQYRQVELRHILGDAGVRLCITDAERKPELARVAADLPALEAVVWISPPGASASPSGKDRLLPPGILDCDSAVFLADGGSVPLDLPPSEAVALIGYTSGTTGRSKGAMLTHGNLAANSWAVTQAWRWTEADRLLLTLPLFHAHGLGVGLHGTLLVGSTIDLRRRFDAAEVYDTLLRGETTMFFGVPTMYTRLLAEARRRLAAGEPLPPPLRLYVSGSAPLSVQTFEEFERLFGQRILERYGMTETMMNLTNPYEGERRPGTVGMPFPGQEARIVDLQTRQPIRDERPGEIQVRGPHVFKGYWRQPEATAAAFDAEGWFNTGDLGWRSADGYFTICGRIRELIISGGYNVYPREVEEVLQSHPDVAEVAVLGLPDPDLGEQVVAAVVPRVPGAPPSADDLIAFCRDRLASFKKPRRIYFVESLPRNALGKVQKHLLREQLARQDFPVPAG